MLKEEEGKVEMDGGESAIICAAGRGKRSVRESLPKDQGLAKRPGATEIGAIITDAKSVWKAEHQTDGIDSDADWL